MTEGEKRHGGPGEIKEQTRETSEGLVRQKISARYDLWISIVDDSLVSAKTKEEVKSALLHFRAGALTRWVNLDDAVYGTISAIVTITSRDANKDEAKALFSNVRDDIWALWKELRVDSLEQKKS